MVRGMTFLVCGDREFADRDKINEVLDTLCAEFHEWHILVEGGAEGADTLARKWGETCPTMRVCEVPAKWDACFCGHAEHEHDEFKEYTCAVPRCKCEFFRKQGKAAGPIRNQHMLDGYHPDMVVFFHHDLSSSKGTKDMVERARKAGVPVLDALKGECT